MCVNLPVINQTLTLTAYDLSAAGVTKDKIDVGMLVNVTSLLHGLNTTMECVSKVTDLINPQNSKITLGKPMESLTSIVASGGITNNASGGSRGVLPITQGGTGAGNTIDARANLGFCALLVDDADTTDQKGYGVGSTITIPNVDNYTLFLIYVKSTSGTAQVVSIPATKSSNDSYIIGIGGQVMNNNNLDVRTAQVRIAKGSDGWTITHCTRIDHTPGGNHSAETNLNVSKIIGIL